MDGFIRMPMLSVELKYAANSTEFAAKLGEHISSAYQEDASSYRNELTELETLRENACKAPSDIAGCALLKKYLGQLCLLSKRFPMESGDRAAVLFTWFDKYSDLSNVVSYDDVRYEMACILHNIGAMHSYLGAVDNRLNSDGMKVSCTHFQCAAYAFEQLKSAQYNAAHFSTDFDNCILNWHINLMLAQAQECILEKSIIDGRKFNIVAKIAIQVSEFYKECWRNLENPTLDDIVDTSRTKLWKRFIDIKQKYYAAIAHLFCAKQLSPNEDSDADDPRLRDCGENIGERIAHLQQASDLVNQSLKLAQRESQQIKEPLQFIESIVSAKLTLAKKDNDFVYHDKVPTQETLPELKGAVLVKAVPFNPIDTDVCGPDIFQRLIPMVVHNASSLYSEEKAKLLRDICEKVEHKNVELEQFMTAMRIDELCLDSDYQLVPLPEQLLERCAAFNALPDAVADLTARMSKLASLHGKVEAILSDFDEQLNAAQEDVVTCQTASGKDAALDKLNSALRELRHEFERYQEADSRAARSNAELHKALGSHTDNLNALSLPLAELRRCLPAPSAKCDEQAELKRMLAKVDEMRQQRSTLLEQFRTAILRDDITRVLLSAGGENWQETFDKELKKHDQQLSVLNQNLSAQENIVKALTDANAQCATVRKEVVEILRQREKQIDALTHTYDVFVDLGEKSKQGVEFYDKLQSNLAEFGQAMNEFGFKMNEAEARLEERHDRQQKAKAAAARVALPERAQLPMRATAGSNAASSGHGGPKLKDYMAYFQAQKYGAPLPTPNPTNAAQVAITASGAMHPAVPLYYSSGSATAPPVGQNPSFAPSTNYNAAVAATQSPFMPNPPFTLHAVSGCTNSAAAPYHGQTPHFQPGHSNSGQLLCGGITTAPLYSQHQKQNVMDEPVEATLPPPMMPANRNH